MEVIPAGYKHRYINSQMRFGDPLLPLVNIEPPSLLDASGLEHFREIQIHPDTWIGIEGDTRTFL